MSITITGMVAASMAADSGWSPEQILSALTSSVSLQGGAEPTTVNLSFNSLTTTGTVILKNLPTGSKGLAPGTLYSALGYVMIA